MDYTGNYIVLPSIRFEVTFDDVHANMPLFHLPVFTAATEHIDDLELISALPWMLVELQRQRGYRF